MNRLFRAVAWLALASVSLPTAAHKMWLEAESGAEFRPILVKADPAASQRIYLASSRYEEHAYRSERNGRISFEVYVPAAGVYTLWARTRIPWSGIQPYDVSFGDGAVNDHGQWARWAADTRDAAGLMSWGWSASGVTAELEQGLNRIHLIARAGGPGVHLDKLLLTDELDFTPEGLGGAEPEVAVDHEFRSAVVRHHGQLQVVGSQLLDQHGEPIQLRGISSHGLQWFPLADNQTIPYLAEWLKVDVVRLAMYIEEYSPSDGRDYWGGYMADPQFMRAKLLEALDDAIAAGIYVVVDWHIHNTPQRFLGEAVTFFDEISRRYGHFPHVIYEICNEPTGVSWSGGIKPYAEKLINTIRRNDPDNLIIVGTPNWSQDVDAAVQDPLRAGNVMYALHYYAGTHDFATMRGKLDTALNAGLAVFVSEWGASDVDTNYVNLPVATQWVEYLNRRGVSWINWSLGNKDEASSVLRPAAPLSGPWDLMDLTEAGRWLQPYLLEPRNGTPPPDPPDPPPEPARLELTARASGAAVSLKWEVSNLQARRIEIYRGTTDDSNGRIRIAALDAGARRFVDMTAARGATHYYWVKAVGEADKQVHSAATAVTLAGLQQAPVHGLAARLLNRQSGQALTVAEASQQAAAPLLQALAANRAEFYWQLEQLGTRQFRLLNRHSRLCLDVPWGSELAGLGLQQWWCHTQAPQRWEFIAQGDGYYALRSLASGKCLTTTGAGGAAQQWDCQMRPEQQWRLEPPRPF